jgi:hypothetical protein
MTKIGLFSDGENGYEVFENPGAKDWCHKLEVDGETFTRWKRIQDEYNAMQQEMAALVCEKMPRLITTPPQS